MNIGAKHILKDYALSAYGSSFIDIKNYLEKIFDTSFDNLYLLGDSDLSNPEYIYKIKKYCLTAKKTERYNLATEDNGDHHIIIIYDAEVGKIVSA